MCISFFVKPGNFFLQKIEKWKNVIFEINQQNSDHDWVTQKAKPLKSIWNITTLKPLDFEKERL